MDVVWPRGAPYCCCNSRPLSSHGVVRNFCYCYLHRCANVPLKKHLNCVPDDVLRTSRHRVHHGTPWLPLGFRSDHRNKKKGNQFEHNAWWCGSMRWRTAAPHACKFPRVSLERVLCTCVSAAVGNLLACSCSACVAPWFQAVTARFDNCAPFFWGVKFLAQNQ